MIRSLAAASLLAASSAAAAAPPACVTRAEAADLGLFLMPVLIDGVSAKCRTTLPADAFLVRDGRALSQRLDADGARRWPGARRAFEKISGDELPAFLSDDTAQRLAREGVAAEVLKDIKTKDCADIDEVASILAPLPTENIGRMIALFLSFADKDPKKPADVPICPVRP